MNYKEDIVRYRLERAEETYQEALLQQHDFSSGKHSGVKAFFNRYFIKTGVIDKEFGRLYSRLFDARQEGDYIDFVRYAVDDVEPWIEKVRLFIDMVTGVIEKK